MIRPRSLVPTARCGGSSARPTTRSTPKGHSPSRGLRPCRSDRQPTSLGGTAGRHGHRNVALAGHARSASGVASSSRRPLGAARYAGVVGCSWYFGSGFVAQPSPGAARHAGRGRVPAALRVRVRRSRRRPASSELASRGRRMTNAVPRVSADGEWSGSGRGLVVRYAGGSFGGRGAARRGGRGWRWVVGCSGQRGGRRVPWVVACSKAWATWRTVRSARWGPITWRPTGRPSSVKPPGTDSAGQPVAEMR